LSKNIKKIVATGLGAAIICIFTAFFQIKNPGGGYIHIGDSFIYLFACILPIPYSLLAGAIGASLADVISGYAVYALPTFIIKAVMAVAFSNRFSNLSVRNILAAVWGTIALVGGYIIAEIFMLGTEGALANAIRTLIQGAANFALFIICSVILSKTKAYNSFREELK
jgi:uncharacterized repeat protein (TIGR04002 family)